MAQLRAVILSASLASGKDLGEGKLRPPRSFRLARLALRMTGGEACGTEKRLFGKGLPSPGGGLGGRWERGRG